MFFIKLVLWLIIIGLFLVIILRKFVKSFDKFYIKDCIGLMMFAVALLTLLHSSDVLDVGQKQFEMQNRPYAFIDDIILVDNNSDSTSIMFTLKNSGNLPAQILMNSLSIEMGQDSEKITSDNRNIIIFPNDNSNQGFTMIFPNGLYLFDPYLDMNISFEYGKVNEAPEYSYFESFSVLYDDGKFKRAVYTSKVD